MHASPTSCARARARVRVRVRVRIRGRVRVRHRARLARTPTLGPGPLTLIPDPWPLAVDPYPSPVSLNVGSTLTYPPGARLARTALQLLRRRAPLHHGAHRVPRRASALAGGGAAAPGLRIAAAHEMCATTDRVAGISPCRLAACTFHSAARRDDLPVTSRITSHSQPSTSPPRRRALCPLATLVMLRVRRSSI